MPIKLSAWKFLAVISLAIAGCGGGNKNSADSGGNPGDGGSNNGQFSSCRTISGGSTQVTFTPICATCSANNLDAAIDGNKSSAATLTLDVGSSGSVAIRATAQAGIIYPAGTYAGLIYGHRASGLTGSQIYTVRTYLNGVLTGDVGSVGPINIISGGGFSPQSSNIDTKMQFDAVEFVYSQAVSTAASDIDVYEFCTQ